MLATASAECCEKTCGGFECPNGWKARRIDGSEDVSPEMGRYREVMGGLTVQSLEVDQLHQKIMTIQEINPWSFKLAMAWVRRFLVHILWFLSSFLHGLWIEWLDGCLALSQARSNPDQSRGSRFVETLHSPWLPESVKIHAQPICIGSLGIHLRKCSEDCAAVAGSLLLEDL